MKTQGVYEYLEALGVLEHGTEEEIANARKQYWREYKANWRKNKRRKESAFTISLNPDEYRHISQAAENHKRSVTAYLKQSALKYSANQFLVADADTVNIIRELLTKTWNAVQNLEDESRIPEHTSTALIEKITTLETAVLNKLQNPVPLHQAITQAVQKNPTERTMISELLKSLPYDH